MIAEEIPPTLATLQAEILELNRSVAELRAMIPAGTAEQALFVLKTAPAADISRAPRPTTR